jgi:hypothetical protein
MHIIKVIVLDTLGVILIITSILFGWLPGVGGIPLFLSGLGLLAINHSWAKRLLAEVKSRGSKLLNGFFKQHPLLMAAYDFLAVAMLFVAAIIVGNFTHNLARGFAITLLFLAFGLLIGNRNRITRFNSFIKKIATNKP